MKKRFALLTIAAAVIATTATMFAQGHNLAGAWNLDTEKSGVKADARSGPPKIFIKQTAKDVSIALGSEQNVVVFNLDGSENTTPMGKTKMAWKGDTFEATVAGPKNTMTLSFTRQGAWLVLDEPAHPGAEATKLFYAKAAAK